MNKTRALAIVSLIGVMLSAPAIPASAAGPGEGTMQTLAAVPFAAQTAASAPSPDCATALAGVQNLKTREMLEQAVMAMVEAGAPRALAAQPSREAVGAGWTLINLPALAGAHDDCRFEPRALADAWISKADIEETVKAASGQDRATCRALLRLVFDGARGSLYRRQQGAGGPSTFSTALLRRDLFGVIAPVCRDTAGERLELDAQIALAEDLTAAMQAD